jgi:UDP-glucose 4-epimerase
MTLYRRATYSFDWPIEKRSSVRGAATILDIIAITGGSGFVGSTLAQQLRGSYSIRILDRRKPLNWQTNHVEFVECDVRNYEQVEKALEGANLVIHTSIVQIPQINDARRLGFEVNVQGTMNVCEVVRRSSTLKGMILTGSWHTIGERNITGVVDEKFGFRPDMVEDRARLYALSKMAQDAIVRLYDEDSQDKVFGIIRMGTVLGEHMPEKTAANLFIEQALKGEALTPYDHSMYRPMLYVDVQDICKAFESFAQKILTGEIVKSGDSLMHIANVYYPRPTTILELADIISKSVAKCTKGRLKPKIRIVKTGQRRLFTARDKYKIKVDISKATKLLGMKNMTPPAKVIERIVEERAQSRIS